ncbi:hypothetical protein Trebr_0543 [Treponema brennaborense DSM 12168]|uniref:Periplasmic binding protein domain-containing protein n=2 Tax=Treponema TaxID=157 RepID=F4LPH5_TREBD|nr:hypothetical protein Trebr_0543 [Treponema brennaborense DSM 12168]
MHMKKYSGYILIFIAVLIAAVGCFTAYYTNIIIRTAGTAARSGDGGQRSYHLLVAGTREDADFLQKLYEGAARAAESYDAAVELLTPTTLAQNVSIQSLLDYAAYVCADGIIVYTEDENIVVTEPVTVRNTNVAVAVVGTDNEKNGGVYFIGADTAELGHTVARTILGVEPRPNIIYAIENTDKNKATVRKMLAAVRETFVPPYAPQIRILSGKNGAEPGGRNQRIRSEIAEMEAGSAVVCFSADDTVFAAQTVIDFNMTERITIIGLYENSETQKYLDRGIIHTVISVDAEEIGEQAVAALFRRNENGYEGLPAAPTIRVLNGANRR